MTKAVIYDFETLGVDPDTNPVILAIGVLEFDFDETVAPNPPTYMDYVNRAHFVKFNVVEQVKKYKRTINPETLQFWKEQGETAKFILDPSPDDVSIDTMPDVWKRLKYEPFEYKKVYTRGNTFDPAMLKTLPGGDPFNWWTIRDTRSYIDGMTVGEDLGDKFMPPNCEQQFVHHHPAHDVALDVMRIQTLHRALLLEQ